MKAVNLIPADQRGGTPVGAGRSGGGAYMVLGTLVGLALMAVLYGLAHREISSRTSEAATLTARAAQEQAAASQLAPYTNFVALRKQRTQAVETLVASRFDWAHAMHEFGRVLPADASIGTLSGEIGTPVPGAGGSSASSSASSSSSSSTSSSSSSSSSSASVASATPPGSLPTFSVTGCAVNQAAVAETIDRLRLMDGVSSVTLLSSTRSTSTGAATGSSGGCTGGQPAYSVSVSFQPLPAPGTTAPSASPVANSPSSGSGAATGGLR